jgi:hypothetical protein
MGMSATASMVTPTTIEALIIVGVGGLAGSGG